MAEHAQANSVNYETFRDSLFAIFVSVSTQPEKAQSRRHLASKRTPSTKTTPMNHGSASPNTTRDDDPAELADFSNFIAGEVFPSLPQDLQNLSYQTTQDDLGIAEKWSLPLTITTVEEVAEKIPPSVTDSLTAYGLIQPPKSDVQSFIGPVIASYISAVTTPPPKWIATKVTACEICERDWVPMTYHHLIPRGVHAKVLKRGWHDESMLNSVAWLCRACHTFVHKMASNEELARDWYTVDKICSRDDVQKWASWVGRVRWKKT